MLFQHMYQLFLDYWSKHNGLVDYFLCEFFQKMIVVEDSDSRKMIESVPENWNFMNLRAHLNDPYSPEELQESVSSSDLHVLTYKEKFMKYTEDGEKTIYRHLLETGNPSEIS